MALTKSLLHDQPYHYSITDKILVMDLDESFIHTFEDSGPEDVEKLKLTDYPDIKSRLYIYAIYVRDSEKTQSLYEFWGVLRPHAREFILFALSYFRTIVIWTAGVYPYALQISNELFKGNEKPLTFFSRKNCEKVDGDYTKPLIKIERMFPELQLSKTMIIDDRETSYSQNPNHGILIPAYKPMRNPNSIRTNDVSLLQLKAWLLTPEVMEAETVPEMNKGNIFDHHVDYYSARIPKQIFMKYKFKPSKVSCNDIIVLNPYKI